MRGLEDFRGCHAQLAMLRNFGLIPRINPGACTIKKFLVKDRREQEKLRDRIDKLKIEPEKQGKALVDNLSGFRSIRAVGQRYRIVYKVEKERVMVVVVGLGRRKDGDKKDIYSILEKLSDI